MNLFSYLNNNRAKSIFGSALFIFVVFLFLFFRNPQIFTHPTPLAEDFGIFIGYEYKFGITNTAFMPYNGYIHLLPRIIAWISVKFGLSDAMIVMNWSVLLIKILTFYLVFKSKEITSGVIKFSLLAYLVLVPFSTEVYNNVTNLQWWLIILMAAILLKNENSSAVFWFDIVVLVLAGMTGTNSIIFVLPCIYLMLKVKTKRCIIKCAIVIACALFQLYCVHNSSRIGGKILYMGGGLDIIHLFVNRVIYHTFSEFQSLSSLNVLIFLIYISLLVLNIRYYHKQVIVRFILIFSAIYLMTILYNFMIVAARGGMRYSINNPEFMQGFWAERYFVYLRICSFVLLISSINILFKAILGNNYKIIYKNMVCICFLLCLALLKNYHVAFKDYTKPYYDDIEKFEVAKEGETVKFHYLGDSHCKKGSPWICDLTKK